MPVRTRRTLKKRTAAALLILMGVYCMADSGDAYEAAYPKTPNGEIEIKAIPASKLMVTENPGSYFENNNELFMRLFRYISANDVSMTVPVEADIEHARMKFYVGSAESGKDLQDRAEVKVVSLPERTVASIGIRGAYTKDKFEKSRAKLEAWLRENARYTAAGAAYAVYWDAPFVPWFLKHSEVHIPVTEKKQ
jgi:DNA gyrase inhibitor GyrI